MGQVGVVGVFDRWLSRHRLVNAGSVVRPVPIPSGFPEAGSARPGPQTSAAEDHRSPYSTPFRRPPCHTDAGASLPMPRILRHGKPGTETLRIISKPHRCLADKQKLALDCGYRLRVFPERLQIHLPHELDDHVDAFQGCLAVKVSVP
jgi:hypothetical protein